jgi:hypothetical protein
MRRQALHDLDEAARRLSSLADGRRTALFHEACRLARYAVHRVVSEEEFRAPLLRGTAMSGSLAKYGERWAEGVIKRALSLAQCDPLPPIARRFRAGGAE